MDWLPGNGEFQAERSSLSWSGTHVDFSGVLLDDAVTYRKAETGAPSGGLGGEERIENTLEIFRRNARAGVGDFNGDGTVVSESTNFEQSALRHGVPRVHEQIQEDLLQTGDGTEHRRQFFLVILDHVDMRGF